MIVEKTPLRKAQSRCLTCNNGIGKMLEKIADEPITDAVIAQIMFGANYHNQRFGHAHQVEVLIYENAPELPETLDIPE